MHTKQHRNGNGQYQNGTQRENRTRRQFLCISDLNGNFAALERLITTHKPAAVLHTGNFGFLDQNSISHFSHKHLTDVIEASTILTQERKEKLLSLPEELLRTELAISELNHFHRYLNGELKFSVPVYTTHGFLDDVVVLNQLISNRVDNLHFIYPGYSPVLETGNVPIRIFGLGGGLIRNKLFDHGTVSSMLSGSNEGSWVTLLQLGALSEDAQINETPGEIRVFLSVASPVSDTIISQLASSIKADFTFSVGSQSRYHSSFSINSAYPGLSIYRDRMVDSRSQFKKIYELVQSHYEKLLNNTQLRSIKMALRLLDYMPPAVNSGLHSEQSYFADCQHFILSNIQFGHALLIAVQNQITIKLNSEGVNFTHREQNLDIEKGGVSSKAPESLSNRGTKPTAVGKDTTPSNRDTQPPVVAKETVPSTRDERSHGPSSSDLPAPSEQKVRAAPMTESATPTNHPSIIDDGNYPTTSHDSNHYQDKLRNEKVDSENIPHASHDVSNSKRNDHIHQNEMDRNQQMSYDPPTNSHDPRRNGPPCDEVGGSEGDETSAKLNRNEKIKSVHESETDLTQAPERSWAEEVPSPDYGNFPHRDPTQYPVPNPKQDAPPGSAETEYRGRPSGNSSSIPSESRPHEDNSTYHHPDQNGPPSESSFQSVDPDFGLSRTQLREAHSTGEYSEFNEEWGIEIVSLIKSNYKPESWRLAIDRLVYVQLKGDFDHRRDLNEVFAGVQDEIVRIFTYPNLNTYIDVEVKDPERRVTFSDHINGRKFFDNIIRANPKKIFNGSNRGHPGNGDYKHRYSNNHSRRGFRDSSRRAAFGHGPAGPSNHYSDRYPKPDFYHGN